MQTYDRDELIEQMNREALDIEKANTEFIKLTQEVLKLQMEGLKAEYERDLQMTTLKTEYERSWHPDFIAGIATGAVMIAAAVITLRLLL